MNKNGLTQKKISLRQIIPLLLIFIVAAGLVFSICSQTGFMDQFKTGNHFQVLSNDEDVHFTAGTSFIYETQLLRVRSVEKWVTPIKIRYEGNPTNEDIEILNKIIKDFNKINGFPGMKIVDKDENVLLIFAPKEAMPEIQQQYNLGEIDKGICQRFSERGEIKRAIIVIESDVDQDYKNSVLLHEIFHMVGFYGHVYDNTSILNRDSEPVFGASGIDTLALKMLYNPEIAVGMSYLEMINYYQDKEIAEFLK